MTALAVALGTVLAFFIFALRLNAIVMRQMDRARARANVRAAYKLAQSWDGTEEDVFCGPTERKGKY